MEFPMNKIRSTLEHFYWQAHSDGELAEFDDNIREHLSSPRWKERREKLIDDVLQKLNLSNKRLQSDASPKKRVKKNVGLGSRR